LTSIICWSAIQIRNYNYAQLRTITQLNYVNYETTNYANYELRELR